MAARRRAPRRHAPAIAADHQAEDARFPITQLATEKLKLPRHPTDACADLDRPIDLSRARAVLSAAESALAGGDTSQRCVAAAIRFEIAIAEAEASEVARPAQARDPLFRLRSRRWALADGDLSALVPVRDPQLRLLTVDVTALVEDAIVPNGPAMQVPPSRRVAAFAAGDRERRDPLFISEGTARILELSDGTRTAQEIAAQIAPENRRAGLRHALRSIEELFVAGLLSLAERRIDGAETGWVDRRKSA